MRKWMDGRIIVLVLMVFYLIFTQSIPGLAETFIPIHEGTFVSNDIPTGSQMDDFIIENGVLIEYVGTGVDVVIPDGVTEIGYNAFDDEDEEFFFRSIVIPESVKKISGTFAWLNVDDIYVPASVIDMPENAFQGLDWEDTTLHTPCCSEAHRNVLREYVSPPALDLEHDYDANEVCTRCGNEGWGDTPDFQIVNGVLKRYLGSGGDVVIPDKVIGIDWGAFSDETAVSSVIIPDGVCIIGDYAFSGCTGLKKINIPDSVISIPFDVFSGCSSLEEIYVPDSVIRFCEGVFSGCSNLTNVRLSARSSGIWEDVFKNCVSLERIVIPDGIEWIANNAFSGCTSLKSVVIPRSVDEIGDNAFTDCPNLKLYVYSGSYAQMWASEHGIPSTLIDHEPRFPDFTLPASTKSIEEEAFSGLSMTVVMLPEGLQEIGAYAFKDCSKLEEIYIPDSVISMENDIFQNCPSNLTIFGHIGKTGEDYANLYGINFVAIVG